MKSEFLYKRNLQSSDLPDGKAGTFNSSLTSGANYTYQVTFDTPFTDRNYAISLNVNTSNFSYYISEQTSRGFKVFVYANATTSGAEFWWSAVRWPHFQ